MLNYNRLKRCLHLAQRIDECLARLMAHSGDSGRQCEDLEVLCNYADKIANELVDQELENLKNGGTDEYINSYEFYKSFIKKWGETDE